MFGLTKFRIKHAEITWQRFWFFNFVLTSDKPLFRIKHDPPILPLQVTNGWFFVNQCNTAGLCVKRLVSVFWLCSRLSESIILFCWVSPLPNGNQVPSKPCSVCVSDPMKSLAPRVGSERPPYQFGCPANHAVCVCVGGVSCPVKSLGTTFPPTNWREGNRQRGF